MFVSKLFSGNSDLQDVADGARVIEAPEESDSVSLVQQALLAIGFSFPDNGIDGVFNEETDAAVSAFNEDRGIAEGATVGAESIARLDLEVAFLEGAAFQRGGIDGLQLATETLVVDPFQAGVLENQFGDLSIGQKVIDVFQFGDRMCFRASFFFDRFIAQSLGRFVEPLIFENFCQRTGPCTADDFLDEAGPLNYTAFLKPRNPQVPPERIDELVSLRRPDILSHRDPKVWYEIKPASVWGAVEAEMKLNTIPKEYAKRGLPYAPGQNYIPDDIVLGEFDTDAGEQLRLILALRRQAPGLIFYTLCVEGDYVRYFNRVRLAVGIAALITAACEVTIPAAEAAGVAAAIKEIVINLLGPVSLPVLVPRPI